MQTPCGRPRQLLPVAKDAQLGNAPLFGWRRGRLHHANPPHGRGGKTEFQVPVRRKCAFERSAQNIRQHLVGGRLIADQDVAPGISFGHLAPGKHRCALRHYAFNQARHPVSAEVRIEKAVFALDTQLGPHWDPHESPRRGLRIQRCHAGPRNHRVRGHQRNRQRLPADKHECHGYSDKRQRWNKKACGDIEKISAEKFL